MPRSHQSSVYLAASPERVFELLHSPRAICSWWGASRAIVLPKAGGTWTAAWGSEEDSPDYITVATICNFEPPQRMLLIDFQYYAKDHEVPYAAQLSTEFLVEAKDEGSVLTVNQEGFPDDKSGDEFYSACEAGWKTTLASLAAYVDNLAEKETAETLGFDDKLRFPIGGYDPPARISVEQVGAWIDEIARLPEDLRATVAPLSDEQLDTPYRPGGWTVRQVVHHLADSHMNAQLRLRWAITEDHPTIKPYFEKAWAELADARTAPITLSLSLLEGVHARWVYLARTLGPADYGRTFFHPEDNSDVRVDFNIGMYAWHGRHHLAHIQNLIDRENW